MAKSKITEPIQMVVTENVIFLYGFIGSLNPDGAAQIDENRDIDFVVALENLCKLYPSVDVRINSGGGMVRHGAAMIAAIQRNEDKVCTFNDGMAGSIAASIWMAASKRYMAENAVLMVHAPSMGCFGTEETKLASIATLRTLAQSSIEIMAEATGKPFEEVKAAYFDGKDHFFNALECQSMGLLSEPANYETEAMPTSDADVQQYFQEVQNLMVARMETIIQKSNSSLQKLDTDMDFKDLLAKAATGGLSMEETTQLETALANAKKVAEANKTYSHSELEAVRQAYEEKLQVAAAALAAANKTTAATEPQALGATGDTNEPPTVAPTVDAAIQSMQYVNDLIAAGATF